MRRVTLAALGGLLALGMSLPAWGQAEGGLHVEVTPDRVDAILGDSFNIEVTVTNSDSQPTTSLVAHIDITDPTQSTSVDPEDWTETLSRTVGVIPPGESHSVSWTLQPISPGSFSLYAVALSSETVEVEASTATLIEVAFVQTLNPEGVLPVVLAGPIVIGALLLFVTRRNRVRARSNPAHTDHQRRP